jgi:hypothetical protein
MTPPSGLAKAIDLPVDTPFAAIFRQQGLEDPDAFSVGHRSTAPLSAEEEMVAVSEMP